MKQPFIAAAKHRSLAVTVYEDKRFCARRAFHADKLCIHTRAFELPRMQTGGVIIAKLADIARAETPRLASDHGRGDLPAGHHGLGFILHLRSARGKIRDANAGVGCIQTYTYQVH